MCAPRDNIGAVSSRLHKDYDMSKAIENIEIASPAEMKFSPSSDMPFKKGKKKLKQITFDRGSLFLASPVQHQ